MMNQSFTILGELRSFVEQQSEQCWDDSWPVDDLHFDNLKSIHVGHQTYPMRPVAQRGICQRLGIPYHYLSKCEPDLQAENLNRWLRKERNDNLFLRFQEDSVRAIFTPRYKPIDNHEVLRQLEDLKFKDDTRIQSNINDEFMMLNIPNEEQSFIIQGKDEFQQGISIANSEVGLSSFLLSTFTLRLICTNGLISQTNVDRSYRHVSQRILDELPIILNNLHHEMNRQRHTWQLSLQSPVDDPNATLRTFNRRFQLKEQEQEAVEWAWPYEQGHTMFHIINTYTKASQYRELNPESRFKLQRTGGQILSLLN